MACVPNLSQDICVDSNLESAACKPQPLYADGFNADADIPYGCTVEHIRLAMIEFLDFIGFVNQQLHTKGILRLESMLMSASFSSMVGEFMASAIPKYCPTLVKNRYHNGHPDLIPTGRFVGNAAQHTDEGIEIKASRYLRGWQGHNPENVWLMVFAFDSNRPADESQNTPPRPFGFSMVVGAHLTEQDWVFAGRSGTSRRTITAGVTQTGLDKMMANWIYRVPDLKQR